MAPSKSVVVVGGGISGLACSMALKAAAVTRGKTINVRILESAARLGGQINTERFRFKDVPGEVIIEAGAEGFVTRSKVFPRLAELAGISQSDIIGQKRFADCELTRNRKTNCWEILELEPGMAARKLGFQVPKEDQGKGIRTFEYGMSQLVEKISSEIPHSLNTVVSRIDRYGGRFALTSLSGEAFEADAVVLALPAKSISNILQNMKKGFVIESAPHHSHVSVHLLLKAGSTIHPPSSFTVPAETQAHFGGLRACSFVNEKFRGRCDDSHMLFRFYFRPNPSEDITNSKSWIEKAHTALHEVFGIKGGVEWSHFAPWHLTLPSFTPEYLERTKAWKEEVSHYFGGCVELAGCEVTGAGLEAAASSGYDVGIKLADLL